MHGILLVCSCNFCVVVLCVFAFCDQAIVVTAIVGNNDGFRWQPCLYENVQRSGRFTGIKKTSACGKHLAMTLNV